MCRHALRLLVSLSIGAVVKNIVDYTSPINQTLKNRLLAGAGALIISEVVGAKCTEFIEAEIEKAISKPKGENNGNTGSTSDESKT